MAMNAWLPRIEAGSDPKYQVIARAFAQAILNGQLPAGEKLPPHRSLASELHVTTGTISRAYAELERQGLANARVGDGTYVAQARAREMSPGTAHGMIRPGMPQAPALIDLGQNVPQSTGEAAALCATMNGLPPNCCNTRRRRARCAIASRAPHGSGVPAVRRAHRACW
jgi:DNA-binding transcriptional regulator YhcF (GntR family)